jgi:hypothetical protein
MSLFPGDIIVSTVASSYVSTGIRAASGSEVSHAMLYTGGGMVIEATAAGVLPAALATALKKATLAVAYRHRALCLPQGGPHPLGAAIAAYALSKVGKPYDYGAIVAQAADRSRWARSVPGSPGGAVLSPPIELAGLVGRLGDPDDSYVCSELIFEAYRRFNLPLSPKPPEQCAPGDLVTLAQKNGPLQVVRPMVGRRIPVR